jgi:tetratricopeptide (TPR) repeat protein
MSRQRRCGLFWLGLTALLLSAILPAASQDARLALVIGNANYPDAGSPLPNAIGDATAIADELGRLNFKVDLKTDLGRQSLQEAIADFTGKIASGTTALFYFSGFGVQVGRQSYLLPTDAQIWTEPDVRRDGVNIDALLAEMHRKGAKAKIVIIDAARRNPFERRFRSVAAGLAPLNAPVDTLVLYSGALNRLIDERSVGRHSLFAAELIKDLKDASLSAEEAFNRARVGVSGASNGEQVPWVASSLLGDFHFDGKAAPPATARAAPPATAAPPAPPAQSQPPPPPVVSSPPPPPPPAPVISGPPPVNDCDRLAAHPDDQSDQVEGVRMEKIESARAVAACQSALKAHPGTPRFHFQLARALQSTNAFDEARAQYQEAAAQGHTQAMNNIGLLYSNGQGVEKDGVKALEWFRKAAAKGDVAGLTYIGAAHLSGVGVAKDSDLAIAQFNEAIRLEPKYAVAYYYRARAYREKNDHDRAIGDFSAAIRLDPKLIEALNERGGVHLTKRDYDRAIADYGAALRLDPKSFVAYNDRGIAYGTKGDHDSAIADYSEALRLRPEAWIYENRAISYTNKGDTTRAMADYTEAIRLDPKRASFFSGRSNVYLIQRNFDRAIADASESIRLDPQYYGAYVNRGAAYAAKGDHSRAIADATQAIRLNPTFALAYRNRGVSYAGLGRRSQAIADFRKAVQVDPSDKVARDALRRLRRR